MKQRSNFLYVLFVASAAMSLVPAFADNPHSTPGLDPSALTGLAAAGYMGLQFFKSSKVSNKKDK